MVEGGGGGGGGTCKSILKTSLHLEIFPSHDILNYTRCSNAGELSRLPSNLEFKNPLNFGDFLDQDISNAQKCVPDINLWAFSCMQVMAIREEYAVPT